MSPTATTAPAEVQVRLRVGDRVTYIHDGVTYTIQVTAVEERADFGFYRLIAEFGGD